MKVVFSSNLRTALFLLPLLLFAVNIHCSLPSYDSPTPGSIEVHLHGLSTKIGNSPLNNFILKVTQVQAVRNDGARLTIYEDVKAIARSTSIYNTLDVSAGDSALVLGQVIAPPGDYNAVTLLVDAGTQVILDGYRVVPVVTDPDFNQLFNFNNQSFNAAPGGKTVVVLTIDLDKSLVKGADQYYFRPVFYVSSVSH